MKLKVFLLVLFALALNVGVAAAQSDDMPELYTATVVPCPGDILAGAAFAGGEVEGETLECGVVTVPENYAEPDRRTIELFYLKLHSTSLSPAPDPLVYLAGGPGGAGSFDVPANPLLYQNLNKVRERRDIIAYDQRGTGYSNYLLCAPFESALGILQDRDKSPEIAAAIENLQETELGVGYGALRANLCGVVTQLLAGVDLSQYNSESSAQDIVQLVKALGYTEGYNLYGTSYGSRLAQSAMRSFPDGIRAVILDGPTGPAIPNTMWSSVKSVTPYVELFKQCAADPDCAAVYPNLGERFGALLEKLAETPLVFDPPLVVNPPLTVLLPPVLKQIDADFFLKMAALNNIVLNGGFASSMPRIIQAVEEGDVEFFRTSSLAASAAAQPVQTAGPVATDLTPAFQADQPLYEAPFQTLLLAAQAAAAQADAGFDTQWLSVVLSDLAARLQAGENQADLMEALLRLAVVPNSGTRAQNLIDYADGNLSPAAAEDANTVVEQMTRDDVRRTLWSIQDVAMMLGTSPDTRSYSYGMQTAFNCADEVAFTSVDVAQAAVDEAAYPQLASVPLVVKEQFLASCLSYPTPLDRSVTDPVVSDIPALLFMGQLDNETPVTWGRAVAEGLSQSLVVEWRNQGHVAAAHDPQRCVGDIAAAFLDNPAREPDLTCAQSDAYKLKFALPESAPSAGSSN
jgi:pimeloyl-ACP methyl ester carboxylesterase